MFAPKTLDETPTADRPSTLKPILIAKNIKDRLLFYPEKERYSTCANRLKKTHMRARTNGLNQQK